MLSRLDPWQVAVDQTSFALESNPQSHWIIGFSGGKDSTALLKIFAKAVAQLGRKRPSKIDIIYCDTGVENPVLDKYVKGLFLRLAKEFEERDVPFKTSILQAPIQERFFVRIIGRGYPPPTNNFRWCTKALRIKPVARFIAHAAGQDAVVALGLRKAESIQRDRSIKKHGDDIWQAQIVSGMKYRVFLPILEMNVPDVWETIFFLDSVTSIDAQRLSDLYRGASGECPIIKSPLAPPCATGRFGCWTCTVVRKDKSSQSLVEAGHSELLPFLKFRSWLLEIRNDPDRRWSVRRNRTAGLGPFTLEARLEILAEIRKLESITGMGIVNADELNEIRRLWHMDIPISS
jgi:DNA sulfur modification protein DndC